jgi:hypothetical protein
MASFLDYNDCLFSAYAKQTKKSELIDKKVQILEEVSAYHNTSLGNTLYVGFNPAILSGYAKNISVTLISDEVADYITSRDIKFTRIEFGDLADHRKSFNTVVAFDEYFTFAKTDQNQRDSVTEICSLATDLVITTCKDYKNQDYKEREFSYPSVIRSDAEKTIYLEAHEYSTIDRNSWTTMVYGISGTDLTTVGPFDRRSMFFKQLANFTSAAGAFGFTVHKNLMYKSLIKKNYEHVISIRFD